MKQNIEIHKFCNSLRKINLIKKKLDVSNKSYLTHMLYKYNELPKEKPKYHTFFANTKYFLPFNGQ